MTKNWSKMLKRKCCYTLSNFIRTTRQISSTIKTLYHIFERFLGEQEKSGLLAEDVQLVDTVIWNTLFEFQKDAVKGAINKIRQHNGCIIADSVGLGKNLRGIGNNQIL